MENNELVMKQRGENKVYKDIVTNSGNAKQVSSTQSGQQVIFADALKILPEVKNWIHNESGRGYRKALLSYFVDEEFIVTKITETMLFLSGAIYYGESFSSTGRTKSRFKNVSSLHKKLMPELEFSSVWRFLEVVVELSTHFGIAKKFEFQNDKKYIRLTYTCNISDEIIENLANKASESFYPMPMLNKPIDWHISEEGKAVGGYETYQYQLVRQDQRYVDYNKFSHKILDSINYIQSTPWVVNKDLLEVVTRDLKIPIREDYVKMNYPNNEECRWELEDEELKKLTVEDYEELLIIRKQFQEQVALFRAEESDYESELGKYRAVKLAINICERYKDEDVIYFPHSYDFRGRVYPLPIGLSPQGSDTVKSLLLYKNTKTLTEGGIAWNWAYLASLYGDDKLPFLDRIKRGQELLDVDYKEADEPYQFLSHQLELQKWVNDLDYIPNTRIHLDACNSGSQFTSAITGDKAGCEATNVIPSYDEQGNIIRKDAYLLVANRALELTTNLVESSKDKNQKKMYEFFKQLLEDNGRKICKVPVMVSNYGGTAGGRTAILWNMFRELKVDRKWITRKIASSLSTIIGDSITGVLSGGKAFEQYIQTMNNLIAKNNKPVEWKTSDGFHVVHIKNKELPTKKVICVLPGSRRKTVIRKKSFSNKTSVPKMRSAISPNYIHSLDAELLRRVALKMKENGVQDSDWIHDSFGSHPNDVDLMLEITKEEFASLVKADPLAVLDRHLRFQMDDSRATFKVLGDTEIPNFDEFDIKQGDLKVVNESDWFFS